MLLSALSTFMVVSAHYKSLLLLLLFIPFHIKPIMRSQRRFENNAVWCERSEAALYFNAGVRKPAFYVGGLQLPREVFWKRILAKSRSLRRRGCQCERVHQIMRRERPNNALGVMMSFCSILLRFLNCTRQNAEIRRSVWKQTEAHRSAAAAKRMNWKRSSVRSDCEFGDMKGVRRIYKKKGATWNPFCRTVFRTLGEKGFLKGFTNLFKNLKRFRK